MRLTRNRVAAAALAASMAAAGVIGLAGSAQATAATLTVAPKSGPGGTNTGGQPASGANVLTINAATPLFKSAAGTVKVGTVSWVALGTNCAVTNALSGFSVPAALRYSSGVTSLSRR